MKTRPVKKESSMLASSLFGLILALVVALVLSLISALFISNEYLEIKTAQFLATITHLIAVFLGSILTIKIVPERKLISCGVVCGGYFVVMMAIAILMYDGLSGSIFTGIVASVLGGAGAILLGARRKMHSKGRRYKRSNR